ncbi:hypothetical protein GCM10022226_46340 [Sphaerisporangium flaviroseum]|uniref:HNH endonuclease n=1 Tax=Sphaerisporangium flaviroseum TaxID=509199 RepID=A0ABP7IKD0_9ACTN
MIAQLEAALANMVAARRVRETGLAEHRNETGAEPSPGAWWANDGALAGA